jgi:hypothetical protein
LLELCLGKNPAAVFDTVWDTIGTLARLVIDIVILFSLRHCYGGAPRGERPASWDAPCPLGADGRASQETE